MFLISKGGVGVTYHKNKLDYSLIKIYYKLKFKRSHTVHLQYRSQTEINSELGIIVYFLELEIHIDL